MCTSVDSYPYTQVKRVKLTAELTVIIGFLDFSDFSNVIVN